MICDMGKLTERHKIPARTAPEILEAFNEVLGRFERTRAVEFRDRKLTAEALLAAIVMDFLDRPVAEQDAIVQAGVPRFERIIDGEVSLEDSRPSPGLGGTGQPLNPINGEPLAISRPRRRKGSA